MEPLERLPRSRAKVKAAEKAPDARPATRGNADVTDSELQTLIIETGLKILEEQAAGGDEQAAAILEEIGARLEAAEEKVKCEGRP